jgi:hypothetical protein
VPFATVQPDLVRRVFAPVVHAGDSPVDVAASGGGRRRCVDPVREIEDDDVCVELRCRDDVRILASGFSSEVRSTVVSPNATSTVNVALSQPGSISGTITQANGTTPIAGAAVTLYLGPVAKGATSTNSTGAYSLASLPPGAYTVQAASVGSRTKQQGATIAESAKRQRI